MLNIGLSNDRLVSLAPQPMKDALLYTQILGFEAPWRVADVKLSLADDEVDVLWAMVA